MTDSLKKNIALIGAGAGKCLRPAVLPLALLLVLNGCEATGARPAPDMDVLDRIEERLEEAERSHDPQAAVAPSPEVLREMMPGLSLSEEMLTPVEERFNVVANRERAQDFFANLVAGTDYGVMVNPAIDGQISLSLPNVTVEEVMDAVQRTYGYQISRQGNVFHVNPAGLQTRIFSIEYLDVRRSGSSDVQVTSGSSGSLSGSSGMQPVGGLVNPGFGGVGDFGMIDAAAAGRRGSQGRGAGGGGQVSTQTETDFWTDIKTTLESIINIGSARNTAAGSGLLSGLTSTSQSSGSKSVVVQPQVGLIMVTAYPDELERVADYIDTAQSVLSREVTIQVQFLEVILNKGFQSAIDFDTFGPGGVENPNEIAAVFSSGGDSSIPAISNPMAVVTNFTDFNAVFQILESRGTTQVLSSPSLKVMNNQKAVFQDGDEEFFQTSVGSNVVTSGQAVTTSSATNLQPFFSGISMDITPQISADGTITLHVHPTITTVTEQTKPIAGEQVPLARTSVRELDSIIRAEDGKIVVLGGLAYERSLDDAAGIPRLNEIPLVGGAFDQRRRSTVKSEFIILLRPIIASPQSEQRVLRESGERVRRIRSELYPFGTRN